MAHVNASRVAAVAAIVKTLPETEALNFYSFNAGGKEIVAADMYPSLDHPATIDFFFLACLHQYGFWHDDGKGYARPMYGKMGGKQCKGSDLLWKSLMCGFKDDPEMFRPERLASMGDVAMCDRLFSDDEGWIPFPDLEQRLELTRAYGRWFKAQLTTPREIVGISNAAPKTLDWFTRELATTPGFSGDPLGKKILLLAMTLANRPEKFLRVRDPENWRPIVDYHLMRVALRLGLVDLDPMEREMNKGRSWVTKSTEEMIRRATFTAVGDIMRVSGRSLAVVDEAFWSARRYCPEMEKPDCAKCKFAPACAQRTELFQPVLRTTNY